LNSIKEYWITEQSKGIDYSYAFQLATFLKEASKPKGCMVAFFKALKQRSV
jgi:hypothetical protein